MKLLLDTHALLWFESGDSRLSDPARSELEKPDVQRLVSVATIWEMAIKASLGNLKLPGGVSAFVTDNVLNGYELLPIDWSHAVAVERLPLHHKDPFDRLLVAQASAEHIPLVSADPVFARYGVRVIW